MFEIIVRHQGKIFLRKTIHTFPVTIGRAPDNTIQFGDEIVSRHHLRIENTGREFFLRDHSTNGTRINNKKTTQTKLKCGDTISIGDWFITLGEFSTHNQLPTQIFSRPIANRNAFGALIGPSKKMQEIFAIMEKVAPMESSVCITGESGTGKELVASEIHGRSKRSKGPFIAINCAAMPASIIEGQLFGHERGAFTGAFERTIGLFEQAKGGTLFLDEIGEMPFDLQTRLLRILESKAVRRIGGREEISVDVRLITATNKNLKQLVAEGGFREDLFFRIFVVPIELPPLRERRADIPVLVRHFLNIHQSAAREISTSALKKLTHYTWPGNVRELKNAIERALLFSNDMVIGEDVFPLDNSGDGGNTQRTLGESEKSYIISVLNECRHNITQAAARLGIARTTLQHKMKRYSIK